MKKAVFIALLMCLMTFGYSVQAGDNKSEPQKTTYADLLAKLKNGDTKIDFKALRLAYTETKEYNYDGTDNTKLGPMFKALSDKKYQDAITLADKILKDTYVEINSHYVASLANEALGNKEKAAFHKAVFLGLVNSIVGGKDGKTAKTAYEVITIQEEYVIINVLGYSRGGQGLATEGDHKFDILMVTDKKTNESVKLYFNIDIVWANEEKLFKT